MAHRRADQPCLSNQCPASRRACGAAPYRVSAPATATSTSSRCTPTDLKTTYYSAVHNRRQATAERNEAVDQIARGEPYTPLASESPRMRGLSCSRSRQGTAAVEDRDQDRKAETSALARWLRERRTAPMVILALP